MSWMLRATSDNYPLILPSSANSAAAADLRHIYLIESLSSKAQALTWHFGERTAQVEIDRRLGIGSRNGVVRVLIAEQNGRRSYSCNVG